MGNFYIFYSYYIQHYILPHVDSSQNPHLSASHFHIYIHAEPDDDNLAWHGMACLKGHGNEADFPRFLQKLVPHRSLTLPFEPFRFWLRIGVDIRNRKTTPRLASRGVDMVSRGVTIRIF